MKVSIITVAYNAEKTIEDSIQSVLEQKYDNIEYIIIDGASTDRTLSIVKKYEDRISTIISEKDKGIYDAMNKGVKAATGDIIGILNSDDFYIDSNVITDIVNSFNDSIDGVYADLVYVEGDDTSKIRRKWESGFYHHGAFKKGWMPPHPTFFVRSKVYSDFGHYALNLRSAADYEFMLRVIHKHRIKLNYLQRIIVKMRVGGESNASFKNRLNANKEDKIAWKMNGLQPGRFTFIRKPMSKLTQFIKR